MEQNDQINLAVNHLIETWSDLANKFLKNPDKLANNQFAYWQDYMNLCQNLGHEPEPQSSDKRFKYDEWQNNLLFNFIKRSYLLLSHHIDKLIQDVAINEDEKSAEKMRFFARQFIDAIAPTNFANINPEVLSKTFESSGENLINGMKQLLEDLERGKGQLNIKITDLDMFKLGENIACTPGKVVYQNDLMQLIQYTATTEKVYSIPLLIIPPWINKYYILDLQQENSLVKWLTDQGYTVFMISWANPSSEHKNKQFSDYMSEGPLAALKIIQQITGEKEANVAGYCIGGTLLGCTLAYLAEQQDSPIHSATFLTTLLDFSEPGELGIFIDEKQISMLENYMKIKGYLDGNIMASVFNALRANDLIWSAFVNNYLKGQKSKPFDLLYWNSDSTNIPEQVHSFYLKKHVSENNNLIQSGEVSVANTPLDLKKIKTPSYFLAAQDDHIVPWRSSFMSNQCLGGPVKFVLTSSGHVAGVVNPPHRNQYGYWTNTKKAKDAEKFFATADYHEGSWWNDWTQWLKKHSGKERSVDQLNLQEGTSLKMHQEGM